ncbi:hypothetical protein GCM10009801_58910 [Streptomyces albiaxialis]|uniref:Transmembrane protein n=1 Tax=Streptomyces albiaxialis TaxID=329523 RepID=A0ABP5I3L9_9ACTN
MMRDRAWNLGTPVFCWASLVIAVNWNYPGWVIWPLLAVSLLFSIAAFRYLRERIFRSEDRHIGERPSLVWRVYEGALVFSFIVVLAPVAFSILVYRDKPDWAAVARLAMVGILCSGAAMAGLMARQRFREK